MRKSELARPWLQIPPVLHIHPIGRGTPGAPEGGGELGRAVGDAGEPLAGLQPAAGDVVFAVAGKVADANISPSDGRVPTRPLGGGEIRAARNARPPTAALQIS